MIGTERKYLFGKIVYASVGAISVLSVFGVPVYSKIGDWWCIPPIAVGVAKIKGWLWQHQ